MRLTPAIAVMGLLALSGCGGGSSIGGGDGGPPDNDIGFSYFGAGDLLPGTGTGVADEEEYSPTMKFPIKNYEAFLNSQVNNPGGGAVGGDQCDSTNYDYAWRDTFCEKRTGADRETRNCPSTEVHQGVDIRGGTTAICNDQRSSASSSHSTIEVVAPEAGYISYIGTYTVNVNADGRIYRLMHMNMDDLKVELFDDVRAGQVVGYLSNSFGGTSTTLHLHLEIKQNIASEGFTYVSPYMSLVRAYERQYGVTGDELD
jgi:murein DD-endopeptidase MepM/ murein hydrolase activator NlpD